MSSRLDKAIKDFIQILREAGNKGTSPLDAQAEVLRIDEDGTAWVHLPGGVDETPVKLTINAKVGDKVYVRLSGGRAWITGNQTAPPTDDKTAEQAKEDAANASKVATNFMEYDSTNGLIVGNKTSGTWSGYRSQILPGSFNVLDPSSTVLASFGPTTVIGEEAKANLHLTFNNLSMVDKNGTKFFEVGDNRNAEGIATVKYKDTGYVYPDTGQAVVVVYSRILSIVSVYVDSVEVSSSNYSFKGQKVTINNLAPNTNIYVEITYTTLSPYFYLTFGKRLPSSEIGMYSVAEGRDVTASGYASHAGGYMTVADDNYMTAIGKYNTKNSVKAFAIGNGTSDTARSNAFAVDWTGNIYMGLRDCTITDSGTALSVTRGASKLDGLVAQSIIDTFSYADAKEILDMPGDVNMNVKKLLQKIVEKIG